MMHDHHHKSPLNHHLQTINYDSSTKSTKGASKLRRDHINHEINKLRDLLPIPASARQRLSQLQLMALILVYVRKTNYFEKLYKTLGVASREKHETTSFGFAKALDGFMLMITQTGRILYISENAAEYLGHSMEDLLIHGDSIYDIVDKQDHPSLHLHLARDSVQETDEQEGLSHNRPRNTRDKGDNIFLCRINVSRNARRQMRFGDQKVILVKGHFYSDLPLCSRDEPVFVAWCSPLAMPENREIVVQGATNVFTTVHALDMKIVEVDDNGERHLGFARRDLVGVSFYNLLHPDSMRELQSKHRLVTGAESDKSSILLLRLQRENGTFVWVHTVMQIRDGSEEGQTPVIICTNQILSEAEATVMKANSWLYHYYMVQSRLQYGLAYGPPMSPHPSPLQPSPLYSSYYPAVPHQLVPPPHQPQPFLPYDPPHQLHPSSLSYHYHGPHSSLYTGSPGYTSLYGSSYHQPTDSSPHHLTSLLHSDTKHSSELHSSGQPLDFSREGGQSAQYQGDQQSVSPGGSSLRSTGSSSPGYSIPAQTTESSLYEGSGPGLLTQPAHHRLHLEHHYKPLLDYTTASTSSRKKEQMSILASSFWSENTNLNAVSYERFKTEASETDATVETNKRVKKEVEYYRSDSNNNSDTSPTYYPLDHLPL